MKLADLLKPVLDEIERQPRSRLDTPTKPRRHKRILGVRFPTAYSLQYKRFLTGYIRGLKKVLDQWVKDDLTPALERHALMRSDSARRDTVEDIEQKLDDLMLHFGGVLVTEALRQQVYENAREILQYAQRGWQRTIHTITGVDPLVRDLPMQEIVKAHVRQNVSLIKSIPQKLHGDVERVVMDGVRAGRKIPEITQAIEGVYPVTAKRAGVIARDQAGSLNAAIVDEQYKQANLTTYIWRTMKDSRVRGNPVGKYPKAKYNHWERDGKVFSPDDPPPDGNPGEAIECRCFRQVQEEEVTGKTDAMAQPGEYYDAVSLPVQMNTEESIKKVASQITHRYGLTDLPLTTQRAVVSGISDAISGKGLRLADIGYQKAGGKSYGRARKYGNTVEIRFQKTFLRNAEKKAQEQAERFAVYKAERVAYFEQAIADPARSRLLQQNTMKLERLQSTTRWSVLESAEDPIRAVAQHEAYHALDFASGNMLSARLSKRLTENNLWGVVPQISDYACTDSSELFAELGAAIGSKVSIPKELVQVFEEVVNNAK